MAIKNGTNNPETIDGSIFDDVIKAFGGNDFVDGDSGDDNIDAGTGNDTVFGSRGDDLILGGSGNDRARRRSRRRYGVRRWRQRQPQRRH